MKWWLAAIFFAPTALAFLQPMSCSYGKRGSLTAICVNATAPFFKLTTYRFDYLDETLVCLNCSLFSLDAYTFDIPGNEIKTLDIRNSSVNFILPKAFIGMMYMEKLLLSDNPIDRIYPGAFEGIRRVKYLELERALTHLAPKVFRELHILEVLNLRANQLEQLASDAFEGLHNLRILDLSHNKLAHAAMLEPLVNLRVLLLNDNRIQRLGGLELVQLERLTTLNLANNDLSKFGVGLGPQNRLISLNLSGNALSTASFPPGSFENLTNLEDLDLSRNSFDDITTKMFRGLSKMTTLNLAENKLRGIDTGRFSGLPHLRILGVSRNNITSLKITGRLQMHNLVQIDLSNNNIEKFDYLSLITRAPKLRSINLLNNSLSCSMENKLRSLALLDHVDSLISHGEEVEACPEVTTQGAQELVSELKKELQDPYVSSTLLVWMFVLITVVMLLIGVLFYVQFFILLGMGNESGRNFSLLRNIAANDITDV